MNRFMKWLAGLIDAAIKSFQSGPPKEIFALEQELQKDLGVLQVILGSRSKDSEWQKLLAFCSITAKWHDRGMRMEIAMLEGSKDEAFGKMADCLKALQTAFEKAGRSDQGINRTLRGEKVTLDTLVIGSTTHRISARQVSYWAELPDDGLALPGIGQTRLQYLADKAGQWMAARHREIETAAKELSGWLDPYRKR